MSIAYLKDKKIEANYPGFSDAANAIREFFFEAGFNVDDTLREERNDRISWCVGGNCGSSFMISLYEHEGKLWFNFDLILAEIPRERRPEINEALLREALLFLGGFKVGVRHIHSEDKHLVVFSSRDRVDHLTAEGLKATLGNMGGYVEVLMEVIEPMGAIPLSPR